MFIVVKIHFLKDYCIAELINTNAIPNNNYMMFCRYNNMLQNKDMLDNSNVTIDVKK